MSQGVTLQESTRQAAGSLQTIPAVTGRPIPQPVAETGGASATKRQEHCRRPKSHAGSPGCSDCRAHKDSGRREETANAEGKDRNLRNGAERGMANLDGNWSVPVYGPSPAVCDRPGAWWNADSREPGNAGGDAVVTASATQDDRRSHDKGHDKRNKK